MPLLGWLRSLPPKRFHAQNLQDIQVIFQPWKYSISNTTKIICECNTSILLINTSKILFTTAWSPKYLGGVGMKPKSPEASNSSISSCLKKTFLSVKIWDSPPLQELGSVAHYSLQHSLILLISCGEGLRPETSVTQDLGLDECHIGLHSVHGTSNDQKLEVKRE